MLVKQKKVLRLIKIISTVLIISAIGWELGNIYAGLIDLKIPSRLEPIFWIGRLALIAHLIEAMIAAFYTTARQKNPLKYGIYTFFVGTVGLLELFAENPREKTSSSFQI